MVRSRNASPARAVEDIIPKVACRVCVFFASSRRRGYMGLESIVVVIQEFFFFLSSSQLIDSCCVSYGERAIFCNWFLLLLLASYFTTFHHTIRLSTPISGVSRLFFCSSLYTHHSDTSSFCVFFSGSPFLSFVSEPGISIITFLSGIAGVRAKTSLGYKSCRVKGAPCITSVTMG